MASTPQSRKSKGRRLQQWFMRELLVVGKRFGLQTDDIQSRSMGANGVDVILSPRAKEVLGDWAIEAKNVESLNVVGVFEDHAAKYPDQPPLLIHKKNRIKPLITMRASDFLMLLDLSLGGN